MNHSATPWEGFYGDSGDLLAITDAGYSSVLYPKIMVNGGDGKLQACLSSESDDLNDYQGWKEDIAFILRAVNCHDELLAACEHAISFITANHQRPMANDKPMYDTLKRLRTIHTKAKEGTDEVSPQADRG